MKNKNLIIMSIFILMIFSSYNIQSQLLSKNKTNTLDNNVTVGIYIINLGKFDISSGSFSADFYLSLTCITNCSHQDFELINGKITSIDKIIDKPNEKFFRVRADLNSPVDLKKYPFDSQKLQIILEDKKNTIDKINYISEDSQTDIDDSITFTGWKIGKLEVLTKEHEYKIYNETYSQYILSVPISRITLNSIIKTLLPIVFIILVMLSSFILDPDKLTTRIAMVSSALVASVMFHVSLQNQIPPVGYLTFIDKFMGLTYFVILLSFGLNISLMQLQEKKKTELVEKIHRYTEFSMLILVPILYILLFILLL